MLSQRTFNLLMGWILAIIAIIHGVRLFYSWPIVIDNWSAPMWVSGISVVIAAFLSYSAFRLSGRRRFF